MNYHSPALLLLLLFVRPVWAGEFSTPEAAFYAYQSAWVRRDINSLLASISFNQEARMVLKATAIDGSEVDESEVSKLAQDREHRLRDRLSQIGFKPDFLGSCRIANKWQDSEDFVRLPLSCTGLGGATVFAIGVVRESGGWKIVRSVK